MSPWNLINKLIHFKVPPKPKHFFSKKKFHGFTDQHSEKSNVTLKKTHKTSKFYKQ